MPALQRRTREDPMIRRQLILDEAVHALGSRGYRGFTVQELARQCGLTNGGLLYYFGSKEELLVAILEEIDRRETEAVRADVHTLLEPTAISSLDGVKRALRAIVARNVTQPEMIRLHMVLQAEALDRSHPAHDYFGRREAMVIDAFAEMVAPHFANAQDVARQLLALIDGLSQQWLRSDMTLDLVAAWETAITAVLGISEG